jgi:hypothetical protein
MKFVEAGADCAFFCFQKIQQCSVYIPQQRFEIAHVI